MVGELLRKVPGLLHLPGETNPLYVVAGLTGDPAAVVAEEYAGQIGQPGDSLHPLDVEWRHVAQWPEGGPVDERYFDGADEEPDGPPGEVIIEMPPFLAPRPWHHATVDDLRTKPLVLCTPRNAFRLDAIVDTFPNARLRVLHLTRNPAAAVNGLLDGWRHHGFYNVRVGDRWWKFDFFPGWEGYLDADLPDICVQQWRAPHEAVLDAVDRNGWDCLRLRFEDIAARCPDAMSELRDWLGDVDGLDRLDEPVAPVMATAPPEPQRWRRQAEDLSLAVFDEEVTALATRLGYGTPLDWR